MAGGRRCFVSLDLLPQDGTVACVLRILFTRPQAVQQFRDLCIAAGVETREISAVELLAGITFMPRADADHGTGTIYLALWVAPWLCLALRLTA